MDSPQHKKFLTILSVFILLTSDSSISTAAQESRQGREKVTHEVRARQVQEQLSPQSPQLTPSLLSMDQPHPPARVTPSPP